LSHHDRVTDEDLLSSARQADEAAFLRLYERHRAPLFRFAYRMLGSTEAAEDAVHDCFLSLMSNPERFDAARASLRTYLYAAVRNLSLKRIRQRTGETALDDLMEERGEGEEPLRKVLDAELSEVVRGAVESLPQLQRESLILFEYEGLSLSEIALVVEADVGTVKSRLHRARVQLRKLLGAYLESRQETLVVEK
jgi:RNA polymerase sigma-70 factor (ECF subfamily)